MMPMCAQTPRLRCETTIKFQLIELETPSDIRAARKGEVWDLESFVSNKSSSTYRRCDNSDSSLIGEWCSQAQDVMLLTLF